MEETFAQIDGASSNSFASVNVRITDGGSIVGQGLTASGGAIKVGGNNLDNILRALGGVQGGSKSPGDKASAVVGKSSELGSKLSGHLKKEMETLHENASDIEAFVSMARSSLKHLDSESNVAKVLEKIVAHLESASSSILTHVDKHLDASKLRAKEFLERNDQFVRAIKSLGARTNDPSLAGMLSLSFSSVNDLKKLADEASEALKAVEITKSDFLGRSLAELDDELTQKLSSEASSKTAEQLREFVKAWMTLMKSHGQRSELKELMGDEGVAGGAPVAMQLATRLNASREQLRKMINAFIDDFGRHVNGLVSSSDEFAQALGSGIEFSDDTAVFLDTYSRLSEYLNDNNATIYQVLLDLRVDDVSSSEVKTRFMSLLRDLVSRANTLSSHKSTKAFASHCQGIIDAVNKHSDIIKTHRDDVKKQGGATDTMNELFSLDVAKIDVSGLVTPLDNLKTSISKIQFFRNVALFRSNLSKTSDELAVYSKDYTKSVGKAIGEAITKIQSEYADIIAQVDDNKAGMGLEIDMYNQSRSEEEGKISKAKLKQMYKWQCDARIGLYKTVEAIDLYLLHFTEAVAKNPDAVSDLNKLLSATKIIAKWYDSKAGDNLVRMFESFGDAARADAVDQANFIADYSGDDQFADLSRKIGGDRATQIYERCRRAVEGVVVLKNIISYFVTISEKYGSLKAEKNIFMAPSNIYKNLVNYIWVSALDVNTAGAEVLTDDNEVKRMLTFEDTKVKIARVSSIDPETMGINFNRFAIDKLRILKSHNELRRLKDFTGAMDADDFQRVKQFMNATFARLGKTEYIFEMLWLGVYDLSQMDEGMVRAFVQFIRGKCNAVNVVDVVFDDSIAAAAVTAAGVAAPTTGPFTLSIVDGASSAPLNQIVAAILSVKPENRGSLIQIVSRLGRGSGRRRFNSFVSLVAFNAINDYTDVGFQQMNGMLRDDGNAGLDPAARSGFLSGFLGALLRTDTGADTSTYASRTMAVIHYAVMQMLNKYKRDHRSSIFAVDDTYFVLTLKAISGKVMAIAGVSNLFKNPSQYTNSLMSNPTRLIMGGASGDAEVIDEAVELYVRLPLLVEFYRTIFDDGNKQYKQDDMQTSPDEERISYVPEVGGVWSGLIMTIFDKSKHIDSGMYTNENMAKIVEEVNKIYKHYKSAAPAGQLARHIMTQLVSEINRRYGIIKREELQQYYRAINHAKRDMYDIAESNYTNNDLDILNEAVEFEEKSPSDEFIKYQKDIKSSSTPIDTKINKLTDYKILKEFRERVQDSMNAGVDAAIRAGPGGAYFSMTSRVRMLKKAITTKGSRDEKYSMIIKAIEESESLNQASNDIFMCFHELTLTPLRTVAKMYHALDQFLLTVSTLTTGAANTPVFGISNAPILQSQVDGSNGKVSFLVKLNEECEARITELQINPGVNNSLKIGIRSGDIEFGVGAGAGNIGSLSPIPGLVGAAAMQTPASSVVFALMNALTQFSTNCGDLVKLDVSSTNRITIDLSEYQKVCEHLLSSVKFMVDKFTGLVPQRLLDMVTKVERKHSVFWLEERLNNRIFNKLSKSESKRSTFSIDNLNKLMPLVSQLIFTQQVQSDALLRQFVLHEANGNGVAVTNAMPIIRDSFTEYDTAAKTYIAQAAGNQSTVSQLLFNPRATSTLMAVDQERFGVVQEFNVLLSQFMNDMYDSQSKKLYTKAFESFAGSALVDAMNGQSFSDFITNGRLDNYYDIPVDQRILSSTLAYALKTMMNRTNPITGVKMHEIASLQEVSAHVLEKYRSLIPMYLRTFKAFLRRCRLYRKMIGRVQVDAAAGLAAGVAPGGVGMGPAPAMAQIRESVNDASVAFASPMVSLIATPNATKESVALYFDEIVNATSAIITDIEVVHKELLETDSAVPLYFDVKKDFTKNYFQSSKELPFAPLSIMTMGLRSQGGVVPLHNRADNISNKFLYGLRSLLSNEFKLSTTKIPYMKKLLNDFNGYSTAGNTIPEARFNDVLTYVGRACNFMYDLRFFNGQAISHFDFLDNDVTAGGLNGELQTFQEDAGTSKANSMTLIESVNVVDSHIKVGEYINALIGAAPADLAVGVVPGAVGRLGTNPRMRVIMVNLVDMNVMPVNVHSLMREIPLANLYNYAMTFDAMVEAMGNDEGVTDAIKVILKNPYTAITPVFGVPAGAAAGTPASISLDIGAAPAGATAAPNLDLSTIGDKSLRFVSDILVRKIMKTDDAGAWNAARAGATGPGTANLLRINERTDSKIFHNMMFLTMLQYAIKQKVKRELDFINTRVVTSTNAVSNVITNARTELGDVDDNLFEF